MQIEIGKYYKTRDGQKVGPIRGCLDCYDYEGSVGAFTESGMSLYGCDIDLIAEWIDKPVTGTLRELNVQVGDAVGDVVWRGIGTTSSPCPVITETVTTQRIVPGVYGRVSIAGSSQTSVELEFVGEYGPTGRSRLSQAELTSAITTLTQIRDALTHNSAK